MVGRVAEWSGMAGMVCSVSAWREGAGPDEERHGRRGAAWPGLAGLGRAGRARMEWHGAAWQGMAGLAGGVWLGTSWLDWARQGRQFQNEATK